MTIKKIFEIIKDRKNNPTEGSYVSSLFKKGIDRISQKVGEEAVEVVIASKNTDKTRLVEEMSDLFFHLSVLMVEKNIEYKDIFEELDRRHR